MFAGDFRNHICSFDRFLCTYFIPVEELFHRCKWKNNLERLHIFVKTILKVRLNYFGKNLQEKLEQGDCTRETPEFPSYLSHSGSL